MAGSKKSPGVLGGVSRRGFLKYVSTSTVVVMGARLAPEAKAEAAEAEEEELASTATHRINLTVNGHAHSVLVEPRWTLLYVLRDELRLTGTKEGCARGECGACTVLMDGIPRYACLTLAVEAQGANIETIEGLKRGEEPGPVQQAFMEEDAFQCGYCTPGQVMAAEGLLRANAKPSLEEIRWSMSGNLCRCGAYDHIFKAVGNAAKRKG